MVRKTDPISSYSITARKVMLLGEDGATMASSANPIPTNATISGDVNVDTNSVSTNGLVGKSSGGDFTTAYASGTTVTIGTMPVYHSSLIADDIATIVQVNSSGVVQNTYTRDDKGMSMSGSTLTVAGASFSAGDTFIIYTNINRENTGSPFIMKMEDAGTYTYVGYAMPGTATSAETWQLYRITDASGDKLYADGDTAFDNEWDERASCSYS